MKVFPFLAAHTQGTKNNLCYMHILGACTWQKCGRVHLDGRELPEGFVDKLRTVCDRGMEMLLETTKREFASPTK